MHVSTTSVICNQALSSFCMVSQPVRRKHMNADKIEPGRATAHTFCASCNAPRAVTRMDTPIYI